MSRTYRRKKLKSKPYFGSEDQFSQMQDRVEAGNPYDPLAYYEYHDAKRFTRFTGSHPTYERYSTWFTARYHSDKRTNRFGCKEYSPYQVTSYSLWQWRRFIRCHHKQSMFRALQWDRWDELLLLRDKKPCWWYYL